MTTGAGLAENKSEQQKKGDSDPDRVVQAEAIAVVENILEGLGLGRNAVGVHVSVRQLGDAARDDHGSQRGNESREFGDGDQQAIEQADHATGGERDQAGRPGVHLPGGHQGCRDHARHPGHRADRQVNATGDHDERLADTDNRHRNRDDLPHPPDGQELFQMFSFHLFLIEQ